MKLAEALALRSDLVKRLEALKPRMQRYVRVQEGDSPAEDPNELISSYETGTAELTQLVTCINLTNASTIVDGRTLTAALAERDALGARVSMYRELAKAASSPTAVVTRSEVRFRTTVSVADIQKTADQLAQRLRVLDTRIQEVNWLTSLTI